MILALDLGTTTGWAMRPGGVDHSGSQSFAPTRFEGGGMRYLKFQRWLYELTAYPHVPDLIVFEEVRRHLSTDSAHAYGGFMATLTAWCEAQGVPYQGVPVGTIKKHATGKGNAGKDAVIKAVRKLGYKPVDDNEADAIALLLYALETFKPKKPRMRAPQ